MTRIATRGDWKTKPMPKQRQQLKIEQTYNKDEMELIRRGVVPKVMEDKWFFFVENDCLFCHRSWTGHCLYTVQFAQQDAGWVIQKAEVNRNPEEYQETNDAYDAKMLLFLIDRLLLGKDVPFPSKPNEPGETRAIRAWSMIGKASLAKRKGDE